MPEVIQKKSGYSAAIVAALDRTGRAAKEVESISVSLRPRRRSNAVPYRLPGLTYVFRVNRVPRDSTKGNEFRRDFLEHTHGREVAGW